MSNLIKAKYNNKRIILIYYFNIIILTLYATYKNGWLLYHRHLVTFLYIFKPLVIIMGTLLVTWLIDYLWHYLKNTKYNFFSDYKIVFMILMALSLPININLWLYFIVLIGLDIGYEYLFKLKLNYYVLAKLVFVLILFIIGKYSYLSIYETNVETALTTLDMFLGRNVGGIGTTNILFLIIAFFTLLTLPSYKKEIPLYTLLTYFILIIFSSIFKFSFINEIKLLISSEIIYGSIFLATIPEYTPIEDKYKIRNGIMLGIFSFAFNHLGFIYDGIFLAIIIVDIINEILNKRSIRLFKVF
jgi:Na+-translocating ferredoxin:NAD+ oxidoreductase RnfD subunit